jgi:hypothetical protein
MSLIDPAVVSSATDAELADAIVQLHGVMTAAHARLLVFLAEHTRREAHRADGADSAADWLCTRLNVSRSKAVAWAEAASRLEGLPGLEAAFGAGDLSFDQLEPLIGVAGPGDDAYLGATAPAWSPAQCRLYARRRRPVSTEEANEAHMGRSVALRKCADGSLRLRALLDPEGGALVEQALCDRAGQVAPDPSSGLYEPYAKRQADALVELISAGHHAVDPGRATLVVHLDAGVLGSSTGSHHLGQLGPHGAVEAEGGQGLSAETARRLACDCVWNLVAEAADGEPVLVARTRRSAPAWLRRELRRRDPTCRFPGCGRTRLLHAHHIEHWAAGGATEAANLVFLCSRHHRFVHEEHWVISGNPAEELSFVSPAGRTFRSRTVPLRPAISERIFGPGEPRAPGSHPESPNGP